MSSNTFPKARRGTKGYDPAQVEDFLDDAKRAYGAPAGTPAVLTAKQIRSTAFALRPGGYSTEHVDAALERLEDAFAEREREQAVAVVGENQWYGTVRGAAQEILDRAARAPRQKFKRVSGLTRGYHLGDVDDFCDRLVDYFQNGLPLGPDEVRRATFRVVRGGYQEQQVDAVLDAVVEVMLAVR
ncbi:MAG: DivIVA domain-containing protein [Microbacteriaceae bacterium]|nr:DivIVA domain-containing protein [Microbacteriaceae bacterium]